MAQNSTEWRNRNNEPSPSPSSRTTASSRSYPGAATRLDIAATGTCTSSHGASVRESNLWLRTARHVSENDNSSLPSGSFVPPGSRSSNVTSHRTAASGRHLAHTRPTPAPVNLMAPVLPERNSRTSSPTTPATRPISLDQPRPTSERHRNLYLGGPVLPQRESGGVSPNSNHILFRRDDGASGSGMNNLNNPGLSPRPHHQQEEEQSSSGTLNTSTPAQLVRLPTNSKSSSSSSKKLVNADCASSKSSKSNGKSRSDTTSSQGDEEDEDRVVTWQPTKQRSTLLGETWGLGGPAAPAVNDSGGKFKLAESTITCPYCRKCRCEACTTPRPLPSRWICSESVQCGPEPLLDYVTCLCCVKGLFYHCAKNHEADGGVVCADKPCSCAPHRKVWRWGCMTAMSLLLPCLCLYWPCKGAIQVAEKTYQRYHSNGCTCRSSSSGARGGPSPGPGSASGGVESPLSQDVVEERHHPHPRCEPPHLNPAEVTWRIGATKLLPSD